MARAIILVPIRQHVLNEQCFRALLLTCNQTGPLTHIVTSGVHLPNQRRVAQGIMTPHHLLCKSQMISLSVLIGTLNPQLLSHCSVKR